MPVATRTVSHELPAEGPAVWRFALTIVVALLLQTEVLAHFSLRGAMPSLVLIALVWYAMHAGGLRAAIAGLFVGLAEDVLAAQTGAAWTLSTVLIAAGVAPLSRWFFADSIPVFVSVVALATLGRRLIFWIVMSLQGYPSGHGATHLHQALWEAALNAAVAALVPAAARLLELRRGQ